MATTQESQKVERAGKKLEGRVALVTGGTRGIGAAICRSLAIQGANIAAGYSRDSEAAERLCADLADARIEKSAHQGNIGHPPQRRAPGPGGGQGPRPPPPPPN